MLSSEECYRIGLDVRLNGHNLFAARTQKEADDAVQYVKVMTAERVALAAERDRLKATIDSAHHQSTLAIAAERERLAIALVNLIDACENAASCGCVCGYLDALEAAREAVNPATTTTKEEGL